jgi:hypothetical protein
LNILVAVLGVLGGSNSICVHLCPSVAESATGNCCEQDMHLPFCA